MDDVASKWEAFEAEFDIMLRRVIQAENNVSAEVVATLKLLEGFIKRGDITFAACAFTGAANLISRRVCSSIVWQTVRDWASRFTDTKFQEQLIIAVLEPAIEEPVDFRDVIELMQFCRDKVQFRVLCWAYENEQFPQNLLGHYLLYSKWAVENGKEPVAFPYEELAAILQRDSSG